MNQVLSINVPQPLLDRLYRQAKAANRPVEEMVVAALNDSIPTPPAHLSPELREQLSSLETMSDEQLQQVAQSTMTPEDTPSDYTPGDLTDLLMLRKAYALVLLKWRGNTIDVLHETKDP